MERKNFIQLAATAGAVAGITMLAPPLFAREQGKIFNVRDFGAKGDGLALDTIAIQNAIDKCSQNKVSMVVVPKGIYVIGTLILKDHITLHLEADAVIVGSANINDYRTDIQGAIEAPALNKCLIYAENTMSVTLSGQGMIDGRGTPDKFPQKIGGKLAERPMILRFINCKDISFSDLKFKDSASWCAHMVSCDNITIRNVTIDSRVNVNNDGFDLDGCKNVLIEGCHFKTGDDSVCLKSTTTKPCEDIILRDCKISSNTAAFKCGTSSRGGFKNITVSDCEFYDCKMGAVKLLVVDGGTMEHVTIANIVMKNVEGPFFIRLGNRGRKYEAAAEQNYAKETKPEGADVGILTNVSISSIRAEVIGTSKDRQGIMVTGIPGHYIKDVIFKDVDIVFTGGGTMEDAAREVPEDISRYPEQYFFGVLPSSAMYIRHAEGMTIQNVKFSFKTPDKRPLIVCEDVNKLSVY